MSDVFISRQPLVNRQSRIIATRLTLHLGGGSTQDAARTLNALADVWPLGEKSVFVGCGGTSCDLGLLDWVVPENATIELQPDHAARVMPLRSVLRSGGNRIRPLRPAPRSPRVPSSPRPTG